MAQQIPQVQVPTAQTAAQGEAARRLGRQVTNDEIANAIRQSGLTTQQIRSRLQQAGLDPAMMDPFVGGSSGMPGAPGDTAPQGFFTALQSLGLAGSLGERLTPGTGLDAMTAALAQNPLISRTMDITLPTGHLAGAGAYEVFGKSLFVTQSSLFDPVTSGPVDPSYRIGAGDQLQIVLTGEVEAAYQVEVRRDGTIILPQVGQLSLAGLTVEGARGVFKQRATRVYSGIASGRTSVDMSIAQIRSITVFVAGEVEAPGGYQVSAVGSVFHALMRAGGPTVRGTFRNIEVRRGGKLLRTVDLYDYLANGNADSDLRVEQGDIIFVPLNIRAVAVEGAVRRPGAFELKGVEGLPELLRYSGGLLPTAGTQRIQIDRLLPTEQRRPGFERTFIDIRFGDDFRMLDTVQIFDGDVVKAFPVGPEHRNTVVLTGEVYHAGIFELDTGMTLAGLIARGQGTQPWALTDRIQVVRQIRATGRSENYTFDLSSPAARTFALAEFDSVSVYDGRLLYPAGTIYVTGAVHKAQVFRYIEHETLKDVIDAAGGVTEEAASVEVARRHIGPIYSDTLTVVATFPLDSAGRLPSAGASFILSRQDVVSVRTSPGFRTIQTVVLSGLFRFPGTYTIQRDGESISSVLSRAGGLLPTAYPETFRLVRNGTPVAVDFPGIVRHNKRDDIALEPDDRISIGPNPSVVTISGAVERPVSVPFTKGWGVEQYLNAAGGVAQTGDRGRIVVEYASGAIRRSHRTLLFFRSEPPVRAGASITVVAKPPAKEGNFGQVITTTFQVTATLASLFLAYITATK